MISYAWINLNFSEFPKKKLDPKFIPGLVRENTFTFESIAIEIKLEKFRLKLDLITDLTNISVAIIHQITLNNF